MITRSDDERLKRIEGQFGTMAESHPGMILLVSLRAALKERDDYKAGGKAHWDGLVALRAERDTALAAKEALHEAYTIQLRLKEASEDRERKLREENHNLRKVAYGGCTCGCTCGCDDFHECGKD